jgi:hypothetical protein
MTIFIVAVIAFVSVLQVSSAQRVYADGTDFGLSISQPTQIGCTATYTISYIPYGGFMETVAETASGVPMATFSMGTFFLSVVTTDTLFVGNLSPGKTYDLTIVADSFGLSHSVTTVLTAPPLSDSDTCSNGTIGSGNGPIPDFDMAVNQTTTPEYAGGSSSVSYLLSYSSIYYFTGIVHEKVTGVPAQFVSFFNSRRVPSSGYCRIERSCEDVVTIYTAGLSAGTYSVIITATAVGGTPYHSVVISLTVP